MVTTSISTATLPDENPSASILFSSAIPRSNQRWGEEGQQNEQVQCAVLLSSKDTQIPTSEYVVGHVQVVDTASWESVGTIRDVLKELRKTAAASLSEDLASFYLSYSKRDPEVRSFTRQIFGVLKDMAFEEGYGGAEMAHKSILRLLADDFKSPRDYYERLLSILAGRS